MAVLKIIEGALAGRRVELAGDLVVGRESADSLSTTRKSRVGTRSSATRGDGVEVEDLGSMNGTWVNGTRIEHVTKLANGDVISIGATSLEIEAPVGDPLGGVSELERWLENHAARVLEEP
jgi:hypothetical protein